MPLATAAAWAEAHARELQGEDRDPIGVARRAWVTDPHNDYGILGEDADAYHQRIYGDAAPVERLCRRRAAGVRLADLGAAAHRRRASGAPVRQGWTPSTSAARCPTGTTLLEASAGTGKTWTIGALVTRYVAEGEARLEQMLVVTFGRAASQELRERVRAQLVEAERALGDDPTLAGEVRDSDLIRLLLACDAEERRVRHRRVLEALAGFDAATIATTHQFCSMVLGSLGVAGDTDSRARLVEDLDDLIGEVVDDLYLRAFAYGEDEPVFDHQEAMAIARDAIGDPQAHLEPADEDRSTPAGRRVRFADAVRTEMDRRKRRLGILSYDDLLSQLAEALVDDDAPARARMRQRWQIVLVDEFQDTDPVQWQVLDRAFTGHATMVLIGDPKQAIYAFRGGDVTTYLDSREERDHPADPRGQLAQRRAAALGVPGADGGRRARRRADRRARRRGPPRGAADVRCAQGGLAAGPRGAPRAVRTARQRRADGGTGAAAHRRRPGPRRQGAAGLGCDVRRTADRAGRRGGDLLQARRPGRGPRRAREAWGCRR